METSHSILSKTVKNHPYFIVAGFLSLIPWIIVYVGLINMQFNPGPNAIPDYRGEGSVFGALLALLLCSLLLVITVFNVLFQKTKIFYIQFFLIILSVNLLLYGISLI